MRYGGQWTVALDVCRVEGCARRIVRDCAAISKECSGIASTRKGLARAGREGLEFPRVTWAFTCLYPWIATTRTVLLLPNSPSHWETPFLLPSRHYSYHRLPQTHPVPTQWKPRLNWKPNWCKC